MKKYVWIKIFLCFAFFLFPFLSFGEEVAEEFDLALVERDISFSAEGILAASDREICRCLSARECQPVSELYFWQHLGDGLGYRKGYTTLQFLSYYPLGFSSQDVFFDARVHRLLSSSDWAGNFGVGLIRQGSCFSAAGIYYDFTHRHQNTFSQITASVAWNVRQLGFHINLSHPFSPSKRWKECTFCYEGGAKISVANIDIPLALVDLRFSYRPNFCFSNERFCGELFVGGYLLLDRQWGGESGGALAQLFFYFCEGTSLNAQWSYDPLFHHRFSFGITLEWIFGEGLGLCSPKNWCRKELLHRNEIIPTRCCWECWKWNYDDGC